MILCSVTKPWKDTNLSATLIIIFTTIHLTSVVIKTAKYLQIILLLSSSINWILIFFDDSRFFFTSCGSHDATGSTLSFPKISLTSLNAILAYDFQHFGLPKKYASSFPYNMLLCGEVQEQSLFFVLYKK